MRVAAAPLPRAYRGLVIAGVGLGLVAAAIQPADAQRIAVVGYASPGAPATDRAAASATAAAARRDGAQVVTGAFTSAKKRLDSGAVPRARLDGFARARQLSREGWRAYLAVEAGFAASRLAEARRVAARLADLPGGLELYADLSLRLGAVLLHLQRGEEADLLFRLAARLAPTLAVTEARWRPAVVKAYRAAMRSRPMVEVHVRASVPGASIELDGTVIGRSPVRVRVETGQHVVVARAPGFATESQAVAVTAAGSRIDVPMTRDPLASALGAGPRSVAVSTSEVDAQRAVEALVTYGELDGVLLVASVWRRGSAALLGQLCRGVPVRCTRVVEIRAAAGTPVARSAGLLWQTLTKPGTRHRFPPTLPSDTRVTQSEGPPGTKRPNGTSRAGWWKSPWLWTGVGAAAIAVGAVVLLRGDTEAKPVVGVDPCEFGGC